MCSSHTVDPVSPDERKPKRELGHSNKGLLAREQPALTAVGLPTGFLGKGLCVESHGHFLAKQV